MNADTCTDSEEWNSSVARNEGPIFTRREWGTAREEYRHDQFDVETRSGSRIRKDIDL